MCDACSRLCRCASPAFTASCRSHNVKLTVVVVDCVGDTSREPIRTVLFTHDGLHGETPLRFITASGSMIYIYRYIYEACADGWLLRQSSHVCMLTARVDASPLWQKPSSIPSTLIHYICIILSSAEHSLSPLISVTIKNIYLWCLTHAHVPTDPIQIPNQIKLIKFPAMIHYFCQL